MDWIVASLGIACIVGLAAYVVTMIWKRRIRKVREETVQAVKSEVIPKCPICGLPNTGEFLALANIAHERKTWTFGKWTITLPPEMTESDVKGCAICSARSKIAARIILEDARLQDAKDRAAFLKKLFEAQTDILMSDRERKEIAAKEAAAREAARAGK